MTQRTVKVRILVAIDRFGEWNAAGGEGITDEELIRLVGIDMDFIKPDPTYHWVTAEVPVSEVGEIAGELE